MALPQEIGTASDVGWEDRVRRASTGSRLTRNPEYQELKFKLHRRLLDKINLEALASIENHILPWPEGSEPRALLVVRVEAKGIGPVTFGGTHLAHDSGGDRLEQAKRINEILGGPMGAAMILAGDLNATPGSAPMRDFDRHWMDAADASGSAEPTYPNIQPQRRIDYVLVRPMDGWRVLETVVVEGEIASDHCPVLVVLEWHNR